MTAKKLSAGDYIAAKCSRCKVNTGHTIVAMVGEQVVKVECNTCGSMHKYRSASTKAEPQKRISTPATPRRTKSEQARMERLADLSPANAVPYSMNTPMTEGMTIQHPTFGLGLVLNCIGSDKMEVEFQSGCKLLRCKVA